MRVILLRSRHFETDELVHLIYKLDLHNVCFNLYMYIIVGYFKIVFEFGLSNCKQLHRLNN